MDDKLGQDRLDLLDDDDLLGAWTPLVEPPEDFVDKIMAAKRLETPTASAPTPAPPAWRRNLRRSAPVWWALLGAALALIALRLWQTPPPQPDEAIAAHPVEKGTQPTNKDTSGPTDEAQVVQLGDRGKALGPIDAWIEDAKGGLRIHQTRGSTLYTFAQPTDVIVTTPAGEATIRGRLFRVSIDPLHAMCKGPDDPATYSATEVSVYEGEGTLTGADRVLTLGPCKTALVTSEPTVRQVKGVEPVFENQDKELE